MRSRRGSGKEPEELAMGAFTNRTTVFRTFEIPPPGGERPEGCKPLHCNILCVADALARQLRNDRPCVNCGK